MSTRRVHLPIATPNLHTWFVDRGWAVVLYQGTPVQTGTYDPSRGWWHVATAYHGVNVPLHCDVWQGRVTYPDGVRTHWSITARSSRWGRLFSSPEPFGAQVTCPWKLPRTVLAPWFVLEALVRHVEQRTVYGG